MCLLFLASVRVCACARVDACVLCCVCACDFLLASTLRSLNRYFEAEESFNRALVLESDNSAYRRLPAARCAASTAQAASVPSCTQFVRCRSRPAALVALLRLLAQRCSRSHAYLCAAPASCTVLLPSCASRAPCRCAEDALSNLDVLADLRRK